MRNPKSPARQVGLTLARTVPAGTRPIQMPAPATGPAAKRSTRVPSARSKRNTGRTGSSHRLAR